MSLLLCYYIRQTIVSSVQRNLIGNKSTTEMEVIAKALTVFSLL